MANVSVGALFLAGAIPGILMGLSLMAVVYVIALKRGYGVCEKPTFHGALRSFMYAVPALATPVLILGGIVLGVCTPTEAAVIAVLYALFLGLIVYREMTPRDVLRIIGRVARTVGMVALLSCTATVFGWILTYEGIPQAIAQAMTSISPNRYVLLLIINLLLLLVGCFMDTTPALIVLVPILLPMITAFGIDRVHFGVVMVLNLMIGLLTPPVGLCTFIVSDIAKRPFECVVKATLPFMAILIAVLMLVTYFPDITLFLPRLLLR
jgi:tripartite ATP-independent transporter DctM subunit